MRPSDLLPGERYRVELPDSFADEVRRANALREFVLLDPPMKGGDGIDDGSVVLSNLVLLKHTCCEAFDVVPHRMVIPDDWRVERVARG